MAFALAVASPVWPAVPNDTGARHEARQYLDGLEATGYTLTRIHDPDIQAVMPGIAFFELVFQQYPVAVEPPEGLNLSDLVVVLGDKVIALTGPEELKVFFLSTTAPVADAETAAKVARSWLQLTTAFSQDGFYTFSDPVVGVMTDADGGMMILGEVAVLEGGEGAILIAMDFDADGNLIDVMETRDVIVGIRPI
jgi:hypothetical protein